MGNFDLSEIQSVYNSLKSNREWLHLYLGDNYVDACMDTAIAIVKREVSTLIGVEFGEDYNADTEIETAKNNLSVLLDNDESD